MCRPPTVGAFLVVLPSVMNLEPNLFDKWGFLVQNNLLNSLNIFNGKEQFISQDIQEKMFQRISVVN